MLLIKPALLGYQLSKQFENIEMTPAQILKSLEGMKSKQLITETNLVSCKSLNAQYVEDLSNERNNTYLCREETQKFQSRLEQLSRDYSLNLSKVVSEYENEKKDIEMELEEERVEKGKLEADYDKLGENSAKNICCKAKVDDSTIDSYSVVNNKVICTSGEENKVSC